MSTATVLLLALPPEPTTIERVSAAPLRWLDDDAIIHRAVAAKQGHPPSPHFWPRLAVLGQVLLAIAYAGDEGANADVLSRAERLAVDLAAQLPPPGPLLLDPRVTRPSWAALRRGGLPLGDVTDCARDLALSLAEPGAPHLGDLADLVDDTRIVLDHYCRAVRAKRRGRNHGWDSSQCEGRGPPRKTVSISKAAISRARPKGCAANSHRGEVR